MSTIKSDSIVLKEEYNKEPVYYCAKCLSLKIRDIPYIPESEYCDECGSTNVVLTLIDLWELMYENKYGYKFLNKKY